MSEPLEIIFEDCLMRLQAGASLEQVLALYPDQASRLRPALEAAFAARSLRTSMAMPANAQARSRARFLEAAAQLRPHPQKGLFGLPRPLVTLITVFTILVVGLVGTGMVSAQALPGDTLYPLKRAAEEARLQMIGDPAGRLQLEQAFDQERVGEVESLIAHQRSTEVDFAGYLDLEVETGKASVGQLHLVLPAGTPFPQPGSYVDVHGVPLPDGSVLVERINKHAEEIVGRLNDVRGDRWIIGDLTVQVTSETKVSGEPGIGSSVRLRLTRRDDGTLLADTVAVLKSAKNQVPAAENRQETATKTREPESISTQPAPAEHKVTIQKPETIEESTALPRTPQSEDRPED